jgi:hypothetical protein
MQVTRLFNPSVIEYFNQLDSLNSPINCWNITNGKAYVAWFNDVNQTPWGANLNKFEYLNFKSKTYVQQISERLENDFKLFFTTFHQFRPFDFYDLYPKLNN